MGEDENFWPAERPEPRAGRRLRPVQRDLLSSRPGRRRSRFGTWCSRSSIASAIRRTICGRCRGRTSTPAWAWSAWPPCCRACERTTTSTSFCPIVEGGGRSVRHEVRRRIDNGRRLRRITDHVRACTFAVHENVLPRRRTRKSTSSSGCCGGRCSMAIRWACASPFLHKLVPVVARDDEAAVSGAWGNGRARERRDREGGGELLRHDRRGAESHRTRVRRACAARTA